MAAHETDEKPTGKKTQGIMFAVNSQNEISQVTKTQFLKFMFFFHFVLVSNLQSLSKLLVLNGNKNCVEKFKEIIFLYNVVLQ